MLRELIYLLTEHCHLRRHMQKMRVESTNKCRKRGWIDQISREPGDIDNLGALKETRLP